MKKKWTDEAVLADALRFATKGEWERESGSAYGTSLRKGREFHQRATAHMTAVRKYWTDEELIADAQRFSKPSEWQRESVAAYGAAVRRCPDLYAAATAHMSVLRRWSDDELIEDARKYSTVRDWRANSSAWAVAVGRKDAYPLCVEHMEELQKPAGYWDENEDLLIEIAQQYATVGDFIRGNNPAYMAARKRPAVYEHATQHMERVSGHDNNAVYAWIVIEAPDHVVMPLPGYHLVKSGVTSQKEGDKRPRKTMRTNNMQGEIIAICDTSEGDAPYFEQVMQSIGVQPVFPDDEHLKLDGYTEFRLVSDAELEEIMALLGADEQVAMAA